MKIYRERFLKNLSGCTEDQQMAQITVDYQRQPTPIGEIQVLMERSKGGSRN